MRAEGMHHDWVNLFLLLLGTWLPWALVTSFVMRLGRNFPLLPLRSVAPWLRHLAAWLCIDLVESGWGAALEYVLNPYTPDVKPHSILHLWQSRFYNELLASLVLYYCILMAGHILDSRERAAQLRVAAARLGEQLSKAELNTLRHQIEPHFLFNVLNAVTGLIRTGKNEAAVSMIARLSEFLRHTLHDSGRQEMTLDEELNFLSMYLDLQSVRFADRLQVVSNIDTNLGQLLVPSLVLQPIVENALKHGISQRADGGRIDLRAWQDTGHLNMEVKNDGPPLSDDWNTREEAIGLANVRNRLYGLYGANASLDIANTADRRVCVTLRVPLRKAA